MTDLLRPPPDHVAQQYYQQVVSSNGAAVEVVLDVGGGRGKGLVATAPLAPGDLVLEERPLAGMQELDNRSEAPACSHCFQPVGSLERQVGARLCGVIAALSRSLEEAEGSGSDDDEEEERQAAQQHLLQIQEHVSAPLLEGLMEGTHTLPAGHLVPLPHPVPCARSCGEEYCSEACRDAAWHQHHCLMCVEGPPGSTSSSSSAGGSSSSSKRGLSVAKGSSRGAGSSSSRGPRPTAPEEVVPGAAVDRGALQRFVQLAADTNDILLLVARVLAGVALEAGRTAAAGAAATDAAAGLGGGGAAAAGAGAGADAAGAASVAGDGGSGAALGASSDASAAGTGDASTATPTAAAAAAAAAEGTTQSGPPLSPQQHQLQQALLPWAVAHKGLWWEVAGAGAGSGDNNPEEVEEAEELAAQIKELVADAAALLRAAWPRLPVGREALLTTEVLGQLIGLFELNNLALNVPSPVTRYFEALEDAEAPLRQDERESAAAECFGLREALGEEAGQGVEGTAFYALHSCINHSCRPNAEARCRPDGALQVVALTPIAVGEEVVISYIDESEGYAARQSALRDYGFACRCEACVQEAVQE